MGTPGEVPKLAMVFDLSPRGMYVPMARGAAEDVGGWRVQSYDDEVIALDEIDQSIRALVAAPEDHTGKSFIGADLLERAHELGIPRAVITGRTTGPNQPIQAKGYDIVIARNRIERIPHKIAYWLLRISRFDQA